MSIFFGTEMMNAGADTGFRKGGVQVIVKY